jgi:hypothetical protein
MKITVYNPYHDTSATFRVRDDGTVSFRVVQRVVRTLCPSPKCKCMQGPGSGPDVDWIKGFEPIIDRGRVVSFKVTNPHPVGF